MEARNESLRVGELAGQDYRKADVFQRYGIDFCCGGGQTLAEAASRAGISEGELRSALDAVELGGKRPELDFASWTTEQLIVEIVDTHHRYVREALPVLVEYGRKVAGHHGEKHPELLELEMAIKDEARDLLEHLKMEEQVLFPAIGRLAGPAEGESDLVRRSIERMIGEHSMSGESLVAIRQLTNNYTPPEGACNSYRFLFAKLKEFDLLLQQHIHLENNILSSRVLAELSGQ